MRVQTKAILHNIFESQFHMLPDDPSWATTIRLVYGDMKTVARMLSVIGIRSDPNTKRPFDRLQWLLPGIGLWHLKYNMLQKIHQNHWGSTDVPDPSTLQFAADRWQRSDVLDGKKFQPVEDLVVHSYHARVVAVLLNYARLDKVNPDHRPAVVEWLNRLPPRDWKRYIDKVFHDLYPDPNLPSSATCPIWDEVWNNHVRYCNHVATYLSLRHAIRFADIGLLRISIRECCVFFQAKSLSARNYAREMIRTLHMVDSNAATKTLQECHAGEWYCQLSGCSWQGYGN